MVVAGCQRTAWQLDLFSPGVVMVLDPGSCTGCGSDLGDAPVSGVQRRQVTDVVPPPLPRVTEYQLITRICRGCAATTCAPAPAVAPARAQYGASVLARAAELTCAHYLPRVRELLTQVGVLHADETPGRAEGGLSYVHVACTEYLTAMHTGGRAKTDIDAGGVLPGYAGTIVRDGYAGYAHLIDAAHAWCGAHLLRELRATHAADPDRQFWAAAMADTLTDAHHRAEGARADGHDRIDDTTLAGIVNRYRGATAAGISDNTNRVGSADRDALRLARRFRQHEAMILRFVVDLAVPWTNNQAERDIRPVKIQQRTSGGCWRTLAGLADFAVVRSYLSTATKWGIETLDAFERLFTTGAWLPPAATPC